MVLAFATMSPIYLVVVLWRFHVFDEFYSPYCFAKFMNIKNYIIGAASLHFILLWPLYVFVVDEPLINDTLWMKAYFFIGWGIWGSFLFSLDFVLSSLSLKLVVILKKRMSTDTALSALQKRYFNCCVCSLAGMMLTDLVFIERMLELVVPFEVPNQDQLLVLVLAALHHVMFAIWFLLGISKFVTTKNPGPSFNKNNTTNSEGNAFSSTEDLQQRTSQLVKM
eukprot:TRINITY_DN8490_c0_g1_i2.p1 TRINITY_DN8490_c0_g1~~TRINITY_DN8490_c0_g1_i2.p1  ORF type:complete len:223 (+),score=58.30 TRINITY_DN8490_c0_g1_i2:3-671(+)